MELYILALCIYHDNVCIYHDNVCIYQDPYNSTSWHLLVFPT